MSVTIKYEFLVGYKPYKDLDSNILEIQVITRKLLSVSCFEIVAMTVIVYSKAVYVHV